MSCITERFAKHAEWILANQLATSSRSEHVTLVDKGKWLEFVLQARKRNRDAVVGRKSFKRSGGLGILARGKLHEALSAYGATPEFWEKKLEALQRRIINARKNGKRTSTSVCCRALVCPAFSVYEFSSVLNLELRLQSR